MDGTTQDGGPDSTGDLTLHEAAALYAVSARTLAQHIRCGQLPAYKAAGATGREWRVNRDDLVAAGYLPRPPAPVAVEPPLVTELRRELSTARRAAAAERRRADDLDRRLGHAMLEAGRLRAALPAATGESHRPSVDLESQSARSLVSAGSEDLQQHE
jgi:excisionase family DNA binding protein